MDNNQLRIYHYVSLGFFSIGLFSLILNIFQIIQLTENWNISLSSSKELFYTCYKNDLIYKTAGTFFNICFGILFIAYAAFFYFVFDPLFEQKDYIIGTTKLLNFVFGPVLLGCCFYVIFNFKSFFLTCDKNLIKKVKDLEDSKFVNFGNIFDILILSILSYLIVSSTIQNKIFQIFFRSYHFSNKGSKLYKHFFWKSLASSNESNKQLTKDGIDVLQNYEQRDPATNLLANDEGRFFEY